MVELLAQHDGNDAEKYLPQMQKEYSYWMEGGETLASVNSINVWLSNWLMAPLNRLMTDTRPESGLRIYCHREKQLNRPATEIYRDLPSAAASGWDFGSRWMDNQPAKYPCAPPALCLTSQCLVIQMGK